MTEYRWRRSNAPLASSRTDDIFFVDARLGWAVGGNAEVADPQREDCRPIVGYVSMENFTDAAILKTADGGRTRERKPVNDPQDNANLVGIGLFDAELGWTGGWGDESFQSGFTSETRDGGETWTDANHVAKFLNRFRFVREPEVVGYAAGDTVYKYSTEPVEPESRTVVIEE